MWGGVAILVSLVHRRHIVWNIWKEKWEIKLGTQAAEVSKHERGAFNRAGFDLLPFPPSSCVVWADGGQVLWDALVGMRSSAGRWTVKLLWGRWVWRSSKSGFDRAAGFEETGAGENIDEPNTEGRGEWWEKGDQLF